MNASARTAHPHWTTPPEVLDRLYPMGTVYLDPASNPASIVVARDTFRFLAEDSRDGLVEPWSRDGLNFCNPPYGRALAPWTAKMAAEAKLGAEIVALLPSATGPRWFHESVATADVILFWRGRLKFGNQPASGASSSTFDNMLVYWAGERPDGLDAFYGAFRGCGVFVRPHA